MIGLVALMAAAIGVSGYLWVANADDPQLSGHVVKYVAMGDGLSASPGAGIPTDSTGCLRSSESFPQIVARSSRVGDFIDVTCIGADVADMLSRSQQTAAGKVAPQAAVLDNTVDVVSLSIGADSVGLIDLVSSCVTKTLAGDIDPCVAAAGLKDNVDLLSTKVSRQVPLWGAMMDSVQFKAPQARVFVVGFPHVVGVQGCSGRQALSQADGRYVQSIVDEINLNLEQLAQARGMTFVDSAAKSQKHGICAEATQRYIEGFDSAASVAPLRPTILGNEVIAQIILDELG